MTNEKMLTMVIQKWGFEHEYTIQFTEAMEWMESAELETLMKKILSQPLDEEEEE